ncbi:(2Fe-2S)-binding protein [Paracoccus suum]|uniref:(2Fe-2S)-binding protein n=1 Tax=Paracoccus suum TaxID=2259340 RepID=A0A344PMT0_9RHOB|nr:(2Fe-2S)-binding protein [Paracoccus suum]AXC50685.1 (2Fe-2S)-binding protein [Paracoccus suum]
MTTITINGESHDFNLDPDTPLLWVLRDELKMTGTKFGCGVAQCGACTVMLNGMPRRSCITPIKALDGAEVTTIEGMSGPEYDAIQAAWRAIDVPQCGWCQSGQVMSATMLLQQLPAPSDEEIDQAMAGNVCRCATYHRIRAAIHDAAKTLEG